MKRAPQGILLLLLAAVSCGRSNRGPSRLPGEKKEKTAFLVQFQGVRVPRDLVEPYVPFLLSRRPSLAPDSARRFILLRFALPMAWALKEAPRGFRESKAKVEKWLGRIRRGETTLEGILKEELRAFGQPEELARPRTVLWTSLPLPLAKAVFSARPGRVEGPLRLPQGWCLYKVVKIQPGITRDRDLVTLLQVVASPGGKAFWEKLKTFTRSLALAKGKIQVLDPSYEDVVPLVLQKRGPSSRPARPGDQSKKEK